MERNFHYQDGDVTVIASNKHRSVEVWGINAGVISDEHINLGICHAFDIQSGFAAVWNRNYFIEVELETQRMIAEGCPNSD